MPNISGNAYALTILCPIKNGQSAEGSNSSITRKILQDLPVNQDSPMARVANTYLARFYVLDEAIFQSFPNELDTLQSKYLVFSSNFYGDLDTYLTGMYTEIKDTIHSIWAKCVAFDKVDSIASFIAYIKKCQVETTFYFNGSTDDSREEQLKSLFLKQEFSKFVFKNQGVPAEKLLTEFKDFIAWAEPANFSGPTWKAGADDLKTIVINEKQLA